ncbi:uncharacterized protein LOC124892755 [Capsicum annuum]|uniref:uncharacterized protein LOC124892755 n=1 Tax=Capsicum annuum TaxID=4072 RepID=UPI001FB0D3DC|nr:uncharacterized protein LOC124892755 [Capsicum annuum]
MSKKKIIEGDTIEVTHECSAIMNSKVSEKKDDPRAFTIPYTIGMHEFSKALYDLGASINVMTFVKYKKLGLDIPMSTSMRLLMVDRSIKRLVGYWIVKVTKRFLSFLVILSWSPRAIVDLELGEMKFRVQEDEVSFKLYKSKKQTAELQVVSMVNVENEKMNDEEFKDPP